MKKLYKFFPLAYIALILSTYSYAQKPIKPFNNLSQSNFPPPSYETNSPQKTLHQDLGTAPSYEYINKYGGQAISTAVEGAYDSQGNFYILGEFSEKLTLENQSLHDNGARALFLAKYGPSGSLLLLKKLTEPSTGFVELNAASLKIKNDVLYVVGSYKYGSTTIGTQNLSSANTKVAFLAALNTSGDLNWIKTSAIHSKQPAQVALTNEHIYFLCNPNIILKMDFKGTTISTSYLPDHTSTYTILPYNGGLALSGSVHETTMFGTIQVEKTALYHNAFVAFLDVNGNFQWAKINQAGTTGNNLGGAEGLKLYSDGSALYILGTHQDSGIGWDNNYVPSQGGFSGQPWLAKFSNTGSNLWIKSFEEKDATFELSPYNTLLFAGTLNSNVRIREFKPDGTAIRSFDTNLSYASSINPQDNSFQVFGEDDNSLAVNVYSSTATLPHKQIQDTQSFGTAKFTGLEIDKNNNLYHYGEIAGSTNLFGQQINHTGMMIAKTTPEEQIIWLRKIENTVGKPYAPGNKIQLHDASGEIVIIGNLNGETTIDGHTIDNANPDLAGFVAKFNNDGSLKWIKNIPTDGESIALDSKGNVYVAGTFSNAITIENNALSEPSLEDIFLLKFDTEGNLDWVQQSGGETMEYFGLVTVDKNDDMYLCGEYISRTIQFSNHSTLTLSETDGDILLTRLTSDGTIQWTKVYGGGENRYYSWPTAITTDRDNNVIMSGWHGQGAVFENTTLESPYPYNHFIAKANSDGNIIWANSIQTAKFGINYNEVDVDHLGNAYIAGTFQESVSFNGNSFTAVNRDLYFAKYNSNGSFAWAKGIENKTEYTSYIRGIAVSSPDNIYYNGYFNGEIYLQPHSLQSSTQNGFLFQVCTAPSQAPATPTGRSTVAAGESVIYKTTGAIQNEEYSWQITPASAGTIKSSAADSVQILWNESYVGSASVSAAIRNTCGTGTFSEGLNIEVGKAPTGLEAEIFGGKISIAPNPAENYLLLKIQAQNIQKVTVSVLDLSGKKIFSNSMVTGNEHDKKLDISSLKHGLYIINFSTDIGTVSKKFIKQ